MSFQSLGRFLSKTVRTVCKVFTVFVVDHLDTVSVAHLTVYLNSNSECNLIIYTVFHKKGTLFLSFIIQSNDDQFTQNFY